MVDRTRSLVAEGLGTAILLYLIVGSGIMVERIGTDGALQLLAHGVAVGSGLAALIVFLGPVSGAHFNPAVTLGFVATRSFDVPTAGLYVVTQVVGAVAGVALANLTFGEPAYALSEQVRGGLGLPVAEFVATLVLVLLILGLIRVGNVGAVAPAVGAWIAAIIVATASTGFANPAVTIARAFTDTYAGIAPASVGWFLVAQFIAVVAAAAAASYLFPIPRSTKTPQSATAREGVV